MYPHRIRLRGPWECQVMDSADKDKTLPQDREVAVPGTFRSQGLPGFKGEVLYRRSFGYPGKIDAWERVWLTFDNIVGRADILLNNQLVAQEQSGPCAYDVTGKLGPRNQVRISVVADSDQGGLVGEVALEVRALAYLTGVAARRQTGGGLLVDGTVGGSCEDPLEVYGILDGRHVHYQVVRLEGDGTPFQFEVPQAEAGGAKLRVELVHRAQIWYAVEIDLSP